MKDLEYIVNGIIVEDESNAEQDEARKKRMNNKDQVIDILLTPINVF